MWEYYKNMHEKAVLILSGLLKGDVGEIRKSAEKLGLSNLSDKWVVQCSKNDPKY